MSRLKLAVLLERKNGTIDIMVTLSTEQIKIEPRLLIEQLDAGQEVMIVRDSQSIARVIPTGSPVGKPVYGSSAGKILFPKRSTNHFPNSPNACNEASARYPRTAVVRGC